jgi:hypothetical protein
MPQVPLTTETGGGGLSAIGFAIITERSVDRIVHCQTQRLLSDRARLAALLDCYESGSADTYSPNQRQRGRHVSFRQINGAAPPHTCDIDMSRAWH